MENKLFFVTTEHKLKDALRVIESNTFGTAIVVGDKKYLLGTITDGDIRRYLLSSGSLEAQVSDVMNPDCRVLARDVIAKGI